MKSLKAKKEKDMEQQNDTNRRNLLKVHVDKEDVSQTIVDNITCVNEVELEVQQDHADKIKSTKHKITNKSDIKEVNISPMTSTKIYNEPREEVGEKYELFELSNLEYVKIVEMKSISDNSYYAKK